MAKTVTVTRVILRCKRCKTVEAHEYVGNVRVAPGTQTMVMKEPHWPHTLETDEPCPTCKRLRSMATVQGRYSERHLCGSRCLGAIGPSCDCSCGGANHGGAHLN